MSAVAPDALHPGKFRKRPVVIEALHFSGDNIAEAKRFCPTLCVYPDAPPQIPTLEGAHAVSVGDWIIKGVKGEFYPCKPEIFAMTYEAAE